MEKKLTYFDLAEEDYRFLQFDREQGRVGNLMCSAAQNICERYLKHIVDTYVIAVDTTRILQADGYYFSSRYPGEDAFLVDKEDVNDCWEAVEATRAAGIEYMERREREDESSKTSL